MIEEAVRITPSSFRSDMRTRWPIWREEDGLLRDL